MAALEPERCFTCYKLFCCDICCEKHIQNKHPKPTCPFCYSTVPLQIGKKFNTEFIKHLTENHLPLQCSTCAKVFNTSKDLSTITACSQHPKIHVEPPTLIQINKSSLEKSAISLQETSSWLDSKESSISGNINSQPCWITSPPEFKRFTSTPMHIGLQREAVSAPQCPNFSSGSSLIFTNLTEETPLRSILVKSPEEDEKLWKINCEELQDETRVTIDVIKSPTVVSSVQQSRDLKRVRFSSDFHVMESKKINLSVLDDSMSEEFFEARQSLSPMPPRRRENVDFAVKNWEKSAPNTFKSSSKVMVMVMMEKNSQENTGNDDCTDLMSLVNTELKKFEAIEDLTSENNIFKNNRSIVSGHHKYVKVTRIEQREVSTFVEKSEKPGRIFTAIGNAVTSAFKTLSGVVSAISWGDDHLDQLEDKENLPNFQEDNTQKTPIFGKRSRAEFEAISDNVLPRSPVSEEKRLFNNVRSPLQKKLRRGYAKIRGRPPIDRMRNVNFIRGVSGETQCFQQGALTVGGDTVVPLPSRAYNEFQVD